MKGRSFHFWNSAAFGGLIMGVVLGLGVVAGYITGIQSAWISNISVMVAFVGVAYMFAKRYSNSLGSGDERVVFTYGRSLGFIVSMMVFAGIIYGVITFVMYNLVAPQYYRQAFESAISEIGANQELVDKMTASYDMYIESPILAIFSSVISMIIYGLFPALVIAALVRDRS